MKLAIASVTIATAALFGAAHASASPLIGDDNHDGLVMEDESGWDCATMGNLICGSVAPQV